ncbi:MAG: dihydropteroate synthase [Betaproteobacteria bacterium]|nr:dihydropteroate synthase [Betaproteobacteria bacterium]
MVEGRYPVDTPRAVLKLGRFALSLERPLIMGIVNITPDSFSDGGRFFDTSRAVEHARQLVEEGADILDIGGESSRPGAQPVDVDEELRRVLPVLDKFVELPVPVSVDTCKPEVMRRAIAAGAAMINDIFALRAQGALDAVADSPVAVCLMHMQGEPRSMQRSPLYRDVVGEVEAFLVERAATAVASGIGHDRIVLDPGFGFGKTPQHNLELIRALPRLREAGFPLLAGLSRKALFGKIVGRVAAERVHASAAGALLAAQRGASIVRVHDVAATRDCLLVLRAIDDTTFSFS